MIPSLPNRCCSLCWPRELAESRNSKAAMDAVMIFFEYFKATNAPFGYSHAVDFLTVSTDDSIFDVMSPYYLTCSAKFMGSKWRKWFHNPLSILCHVDDMMPQHTVLFSIWRLFLKSNKKCCTRAKSHHERFQPQDQFWFHSPDENINYFRCVCPSFHHSWQADLGFLSSIFFDHKPPSCTRSSIGTIMSVWNYLQTSSLVDGRNESLMDKSIRGWRFHRSGFSAGYRLLLTAGDRPTWITDWTVGMNAYCIFSARGFKSETQLHKEQEIIWGFCHVVTWCDWCYQLNVSKVFCQSVGRQFELLLATLHRSWLISNWHMVANSFEHFDNYKFDGEMADAECRLIYHSLLLIQTTWEIPLY